MASTTQVYHGYIMKYQDPLNIGRYAVYVPELFPQSLPGQKYIWCKNGISNYVKTRDPFTHEFIEYGSYIPLVPGTKVLIKFETESSNSGVIYRIDSNVSVPHNLRDDYYLIYQTKNGSKMYVDNNDLFHIEHANGYSNITMLKDSIKLQLQQTKPEKADKLTELTSIELSQNGILFKAGNYTMTLNNNGFSIGNTEGKSYINMTKKIVSINAEKSINLSAEDGAIHAYSNQMFLTGISENHILGNDLRLTGQQKAQLSATTVNVQGWLDTHIKAMNVSIDSLLRTSITTLTFNKTALAYSNTYASLLNTSSQIKTDSTVMYARGASMNLIDGMTINNMGMGSSISASLGVTLSGIELSLYATLMTMNTTMLLNDPTGIMAATNATLASGIAGTASNAIGTVPVINDVNNVKDYVSDVVNKNKKILEDTKKYIQPDNIVSL